jgi:hypothetical protein
MRMSSERSFLFRISDQFFFFMNFSSLTCPSDLVLFYFVNLIIFCKDYKVQISPLWTYFQRPTICSFFRSKDPLQYAAAAINFLPLVCSHFALLKQKNKKGDISGIIENLFRIRSYIKN